MRAFISYSLNDSEQFVLSILAHKLKEQGFIVSSSYNLSSSLIDFQTYSQLNKSTLFIGIITGSGMDINRVYSEWQVALQRRIPAILLIEDVVAISQELQNHPNIVRFNKLSPEVSIEAVRQKISASSQVSIPTNEQSNDNKAAWLLGGLAVLLLIGLLSKED